MIKYILGGLLALSFLSSVQAQGADTLVARLERQRFEAQVQKNMPVLEKIFADDLVYIHSNGKKDSKTTYLQSIVDGKSSYGQISIEALDVRLYARQKVAVVNGLIVIENEGQPPARLRYVVVYDKRKHKGWQLNSWQSLKLSK